MDSKNEVVVYSDKIKERTIRIKTIQDNVCQGMIDIGKELIEIKKELGHGQWLPYIEKELGYSRRTASNFMKVAQEFGNGNTYSHLTSYKIIALLDIPQENRDDFIQSTTVEDLTVRQLKNEIQKYKEENGLLTKKQQQALDEKKRIEQELKLEKSKKPKVETKFVEKVVEKVVDKTDYTTLSKLKKLEDDNKRLEESKRVFENAMNTYKQEANNYKNFKDKFSRMVCIDGGDIDEIKALDDVNSLYISINNFIRQELSPVKYDNCMRFINISEPVTQSFINMINVVEDWCLEMREKLNENNNIITVEVE